MLNRLVIDPCPAQDFNDADFLYFSSFQAFVDRAEWKFLRPMRPQLTTRQRDIVYHGNIEPGEHVTVTLRAVRHHDGGDNALHDGRLAHWCGVAREADGVPLADVFTSRGDCCCGDAT